MYTPVWDAIDGVEKAIKITENEEDLVLLDAILEQLYRFSEEEVVVLYGVPDWCWQDVALLKKQRKKR